MIEITIASPPDRERVVAELWQDDTQLAEVSNEHGSYHLEIYTPPGTNRVGIGLDEFESALALARQKLAY